MLPQLGLSMQLRVLKMAHVNSGTPDHPDFCTTAMASVSSLPSSGPRPHKQVSHPEMRRELNFPSRRPLSQRILPGGVVRETLRHGALTVLSKVLREQTKEALSVNRVQNIYLHFLPEDETGAFVSLIRLLRRDHEFLSYSNAVEKASSGAADRPYLSISFDDGFESNLRAAEILAAEGISACFFICPNLVGLDRHQLAPTFPGALGEEQRTLNWGEVERLLELGHEVGSHTLDHRVLSEIPLDEATRQIRGSKEVLESHLGSIRHFAWPRGQFHHFGPELAQEVRGAGYLSCASAVRGAHLSSVPLNQLCLRREHWVTGWPKDHMLCLMGRSIRRSDDASGRWPTGWMPESALT